MSLSSSDNNSNKATSSSSTTSKSGTTPIPPPPPESSLTMRLRRARMGNTPMFKGTSGAGAGGDPQCLCFREAIQ